MVDDLVCYDTNYDDNPYVGGNCSLLLKYLGLEGKSLSEIKTIASSTRNASDFRAVEIEGEKTSGQDVNVILGGLEWTCCYLSQDNSGNPVLTLWLSNSTQDAFAGRSNDEGERYGYITDDVGTRLFSDFSCWNNSSTETLDCSYPIEMYGTSYIRAVTLNNGGKYSIDGETLSDEVEQSLSSVFSLYTMNYDFHWLSYDITTPSEISWQERGQCWHSDYLSPNEEWGYYDDVLWYYPNPYYSSLYNYSSKSGYDTWKDDKLWLPSLYELRNLWGLSENQLKDHTGVYEGTYYNLFLGENDVDGSVFDQTWTRTGRCCESTPSHLTSDGNSDIFLTTGCYGAVRPALHLDLSSFIWAIENSVITEISYDANGGTVDKEKEVVYFGDYPNSYYNLLNLPTPIKEGYRFRGWYLDEKFTQPVTNETKLSTDKNHTLYAKWGDLIEYRSYYDYFIDNMGCTGVYDDNGVLVGISEENYPPPNYDEPIWGGLQIEGSGTSTDPYQINTSLAFWYMSKFINLSNKYVELNCDVILNDETFDENGNVIVDENGEPIYGDGIVYQWKPINGFTGTFNGHGHIVYGYYYNNPESSYTSFFGESVVKELKNLNMQNAFLRVDSGYGIMIHIVENIENCHVLSGHMIAENGISAGIAYQVSKSLKNCSNYASIEGGQALSGILANINSGVTIDGAINYGDVTGGWAAGGILAHTKKASGAIIKNCKNYGRIEGTSHVSGMIGIAYGGESGFFVSNCSNYGEITSQTDENCSSICSFLEGNWCITNCKNYGKIDAKDTGMLISHVGVWTNSVNTKIEINDCYVYSDKNYPVIHSLHNNENWTIDISVNGLELDYDINNDSSYTYWGIVCHHAAKNHNGTLKFRNINLNIKCKNFSERIVGKADEISNVLVNVECSTYSNRDIAYNGFAYGNGILINIKGKTSSLKQYYGTNFRDFYVSWRTGKIGLSSLDGVGTFQGKITEEWLKEKGFEKKG